MLGFYTLLWLGVSQFANHLAINITDVRLRRSATVTNLQAEPAKSLIDCLKYQLLIKFSLSSSFSNRNWQCLPSSYVQSYRINIAESTMAMTMTVKNRYKALIKTKLNLT